ncbi:hypothetical protein [Tabrizicola sp.]|uniref:hypothetical protein n=1 Tax=Tabrizicola sp. TaxID=2005166 RepID=UPI001A47ACCC|nr:hypothetical protein [Tabrizicola sp.]MBL9062756.1 hypothetical protein [Tabrizicola sp.]
MTGSDVKGSGAVSILIPAPSSVTVTVPKAMARGSGEKKVEDAVYQFIRAKRILGQTRINTATIADALDIPHRAVEKAVRGMSSRGVRRLG